ncbi:aminoglycoside phosphotransferase (APT) family kinase protein [Kitasatospora sp. MAP12-15]|uniref:aminoglycoside phosphotransferase family protein n=1 Tax=unclassified Kitasatospora TaxID=2633591 RepID=UPI002472F126|nr:aminoglycoside phosphotransferase family protein [Kitasatospora sp. MAP12-44]MDH6108353.1 aminoglycoside phosphotransferase (APT) family kinase protein [Kitasatospora sp. MAP12-44]
MKLHENEIRVDEAVVRSLLREQRPEWAALPISPAGAGTDNRMYRLGDQLLIRLPRTPDNAQAVRKEQTWLPRLAPHLPCRIPEPVHDGAPGSAFPLAWSVYRWIDGDEAGLGSVTDWPAFGADLATIVRSLHSTPLMGATGQGELSWYRGGDLHACDEWVSRCFDNCRTIQGLDLNFDLDFDFDLARLQHLWQSALALPEPSSRQVWLHGDLRPTNLLVQQGKLHAVIDFGSLSVGFPDAEHSPLWDLPPGARQAYWDTMSLDDLTWLRARAWAIAVGVSGVSYYWDSYPAFVSECLSRLRAILEAADER